MPDEMVAIDIEGLPSLLDQLDAITDPGMMDGLNDVADYLRGALRNQPPYQHVTRAAAFPEVGGWFSDRQHKKVMAMIASGEITPGQENRTGTLRDGWQIAGKGTMKPMLFNDAPHAMFAHGNQRQSRMQQKIGWKKIGEMTEERAAQIARLMADAVRKAMKKRRK